MTSLFRRCIRYFSGLLNRCMLPWAACFGLLISTPNCPCCGQPVCPKGTAGMAILAGLSAAVTGLFRRRPACRPETDFIPASSHPEPRKIKATVKLGLPVLLCALAIYACAHTSQDQATLEMTDVSFYDGIIKSYRGPLNHLKAVRRGVCPMYPSCSEYSRQAIARFGFLKGWVMSMDRLMRCGRDEMHLAPKIWVDGQLKYFDPIENNDLWHNPLKN